MGIFAQYYKFQVTIMAQRYKVWKFLSFIAFVLHPFHRLLLLLQSSVAICKMLSTISVLALAIAAQAAAVPVSAPAGSFGSSRFSVPAVHNANFQRNGTAALLKAYAKYNLKPTKQMPAAFMSALKKRQDGSATAAPSDGVEYLVTTSVGGQSLNLDFDTGRADL